MKLLTEKLQLASFLDKATFFIADHSANSMQINVEFFGIPRARAGVAQTTVEGDSLGEVLDRLACRFPALAEHCIDGHLLRPGYTANLGGNRFVTDPQTPLVDGDTLLLLNLDAGG